MKLRKPTVQLLVQLTFWLHAVLITSPITGILHAQFVIGEKLPQKPLTQKNPQKPLKTKPLKFVYDGNPIVLPLDCSYEHFNQAGITCSETLPCELLLELIAIENAGESIFTVGNVHTASATVASVLLMSEDAGKTWREPIGRYSGGTFEDVQFVGQNHGWVVGHQRELDSSTKPLLLSTYDAGKYWQRYQISKDGDHTGTILEFHFDTETHGFMIIDRGISTTDPFELHESMNGGKSWLIRQITSHKPKLRNRPVASQSSNWQIRSDVGTGNYIIEHRHKDVWSIKSRFAFGLGACDTVQQSSVLE